MSQKRGRWYRWPGYGQLRLSSYHIWLTYHSTTSLVDEEDLADDIWGKSIGCTTTYSLEESSSKQAVVGLGFACPYRCRTENGKANKDDRTTSKGWNSVSMHTTECLIETYCFQEAPTRYSKHQGTSC